MRIRSRALALAAAALVACTASAQPKDDCGDRVRHMRDVLGTTWERAETPSGVAAWVPALYRDFRHSTDPTARAKLLDEGVGRTIHGCYGLADAFYQSSRAPAGARRAAMTRLIPAALESCRCRGVDVESLGFLLQLSPAG